MNRVNQQQRLQLSSKIIYFLEIVVITTLINTAIGGCSMLQQQSPQERLALENITRLFAEEKYVICLQEFKNIPQSYSIYSEAQAIMNKCAQSRLEEAKSYAKEIPFQSYIPAANNLYVAIRYAKEIPQESSIYEEAQNLIKQWNAEIQSIEKSEVTSTTSVDSFLEKGMLYSEARGLLIDAGWQPAQLNSVFDCSDCQLDPRIRRYVKQFNYTEVETCSGTGLGFCRFTFHNSQGEKLFVTTVGNSKIAHGDSGATVWGWMRESDRKRDQGFYGTMVSADEMNS